MKKIAILSLMLFTACLVFANGAIEEPFPAADSGAAIPEDGLGTVATHIGPLNFENGFPTDETVADLYDELDFQRACQAYLWALPMVSMAEWQRAQQEDFGAGPYDFVFYLTAPDKMGILTANATTPYIMSFVDMTESGPIVVDVPAGLVAGGVMDYWERPVTDLGQTGPDAGKGGKYIILGPEHEEIDAEGYFVYRSATNHLLLGLRALAPDLEEATRLANALQCYPYSERDNPPESTLRYPEGKYWEGHQPRGIAYWERLADILETEPVETRDRMMMAMLRPLGIGNGLSFNPDERTRRILTEASLVGEAMARANSYAKRFEGTRVWPGVHWEYALFLEEVGQELPTHTQLDERSSWYYEAIGVSEGMMGRIVNAGQVYLEAQKDSEGNWLDGSNTYRLRIPSDAPVLQFWSVSIYDNSTRCLIQNDGRPDLSSRMPLEYNDDGSVYLYFGLEAPEGLENNWVKTIPNRGWFTYFRLYAPTQPYFDKTWSLPDIEKMN